MAINIALLPYKNSVFGPVTQQKLARLCAAYSLVFLLAQGLFWLNNAASHTFALGLLWPGAGFLAINGFAHWLMALSGFGLFLIALLLWFGTGNVIAPLLAWLGSALGAAVMAQGASSQRIICSGSALNGRLLITSAVAIGCILLDCIQVYRLIVGKKQRQLANHYLRKAAPAIAASFKKTEKTTNNELSVGDLKHLRFLLDRALQPLENFDGFDWIDQFQTAAVRYQLNFMGYALSTMQATHCPAFAGYLSDAQHNLIIKQTDHRVWGYWRLENAWGNFSANPDPIARDNIMYTGFCAAQIALYHATSNSDYFLQTGSFAPADKKGKRYVYDFKKLISKLGLEWSRSSYHLMACEPNWVYPLCNTIGAAAVKAHDANLWAQHAADFEQKLEQEFMTFNGRMIPCRSSDTGLAFPAIGGALPQALPCLFLNATLPDIAMRQWLLLRRNLISNQQLNKKMFWPIDTGNYGFSRAAAYAATALAAAELGDSEIAQLCQNVLETEYPSVEINGVAHRPKASVWAHALAFCARVQVKNGFRQLIQQPLNVKTPIIKHVNYPAVLVAHASYQQGVLRAVLYNGAGAGPQIIGLANLQPHALYGCHGAQTMQITADANGEAALTLLIDGRTEINIFAQSSESA